jgi:hypothetical protein
MLDGLRKRLAGLFLKFCQTPDYNPEASRFQVAAAATASSERFMYADVERERARANPVPIGDSIRAC